MKLTLDRSAWTIIIFKLALGLLGLSAIVTEIAVLTERGSFVAANFFGYFTILSNVLVAVALIASAVLTAAGRGRRLDALRGATTVYILLVGLGFSILLAGLDDTVFTAVAWDNVVLHYVVPIGALVDVLVDPPRRLRLGRSLAWLAFPLGYLAFSLVRGEVTGWYPYPFLDPATEGVAAVAATSAGLVVVGALLIWGVCRLSGRGRQVTAD